MSATNALSARLIGSIFLERGLVTEEQLQAALAQQVETKEHLGEILVQYFGVSRIELASVLAEQWAELERTNASNADQAEPTPKGEAAPLEPDRTEQTPEAADEDGAGTEEDRRPLGEIFVEQGLVTDEQLDQALETQRQGGERLGEILVAQGSITRLQLASALGDQWTALQKIRPPSASEPPAGGLSLAPSDAPSVEVDRLHEAVAALEQRLRAAETLAAREPWREEISAATEGLQTTVAEIEARLEAAATREEPGGVGDLRTALDDLAERVEVLTTTERMHDADLLRRVESAAEAAEAARSGLGGAFESLSLRLADVESRIHDRSDITTLQGELETLVEQVSELATERTSSEADELRDEVQRLLDEVKRRAATTADTDPALTDRVETLVGRVDEISAAIRALKDASSSTAGADALEEALAALAQRLQALETRDGPELEEIRHTLADIEARPAMESVLADRLAHYGAGPDALDELKARLSEVERLSSELPRGNPELEERVDALAARFQTLEGSTAIGPELDELHRAVRELAARPAVDPDLSARVEHLARELDESRAADTQIEELRSRTDELTSRLHDAESHRIALDDLRRQLDDLNARQTADPEQFELLSHRLEEASIASRAELSALEERLQAVADRPAPPTFALEQIDELRVGLEELSAQVGAPAEVSQLRAGLSALEARLDAVADRPAPTIPLEQIGELRRDVDDLTARRAVDPELVEQLSRQVDELSSASRAELSALDARLEAIAERPAPTFPLEQVDELRHGLQELSAQVGAPAEVSQLRAELSALEARLDAVADRPAPTIPLEQIGELRRDLDDLNARRTVDPEQFEQLSRRLEEASSASRAELSALEERLEAVADRPAPTFPLEQIDELRRELTDLTARQVVDPELVEQLSRQVDELSSASRAELSALDARLEAIAERPVPTFPLEQVDELRRGLEELSAQVGAPVEQVSQLRAELTGLEERLDTIASRPAPTIPLEQIDELGTRIDALEDTSTGSELAELRSRVEGLAVRPAADPEIVDRLARRIEEVSGPPPQLEELRRRVDALSSQVGAGESTLAERISHYEAKSVEVHELEQRLLEIERHTAELAESDPELADQLAALASRLNVLEGDTTAAELGQLRRTVEELASGVQGDAILADRVEQLARELEASAAAANPELAELRRTVADLAARPVGDPSLTDRLEELRSELESLAQAGETVRADSRAHVEELSADLRRELKRVASRVAAVEELATQEQQDEHGPRIETLEHRLADGESRGAGFEARIDDVTTRVDSLAELGSRVDGLDERLGVHEDRHATSARKADLSGLREDLSQQLEGLEQRFEQLAVAAGDNEESLARRLTELAHTLQSEIGGQQVELGDRLAATERETVSLSAELDELRSVAKDKKAWRSRVQADLHRQADELGRKLESSVSSARDELAPAVAHVRAELDALAARMDSSDTKVADVLEGLRVELEQIEQAVVPVDDTELRTRIEDLEQRFALSAAQAEEQVRATEEALRAGLTSLGERLADTESTYVEAGSALRRSIERLGAAIVDADVLISERDGGDVAVEEVVAGPFLAFVPNGNGYSLQEVHGKPPLVGEAMSVVDDDGEFVVTRVGRSPLPLDRRRCVYLEPRGRWEIAPPNSVT